jgi:membrane protein YqaA with SNARE-associated domain
LKIFQKWLDKLWSVAGKKGAERVLMSVSFMEAVFFPVPPDLLLIPMGLANRRRVFVHALICLVFSLLGGIVGYLVGYFFMEVAGWPIIDFYGLGDKYEVIRQWYETYSAWAVAVAGLTPIPYKLCTLTAGAFEINWLIFVVASTLSRGIRFFAIATAIFFFGEAAREFLEKRFNLVVSMTVVLVVLGFVVIRYL